MKKEKAKAKKSAIKKRDTIKKRATIKKKKPQNELDKVDFKKLQKEVEKKQEKIQSEVPNNKVTKPKFKRVKVYDNGVEMYLSDNRKVAIALEEDGSFVLETKKVLKADEPFSAFSPAKIKYMKKWGVKVASCQLNISKEALIAIGMGISEMLKSGVFNEQEKK